MQQKAVPLLPPPHIAFLCSAHNGPTLASHRSRGICHSRRSAALQCIRQRPLGGNKLAGHAGGDVGWAQAGVLPGACHQQNRRLLGVLCSIGAPDIGHCQRLVYRQLQACRAAGPQRGRKTDSTKCGSG